MAAARPRAGCDLCADAGPLHLRGRCHPTAPLRAVLTGDVIELRCYVPACDRVVARFRLAEQLPAETP